LELGQSYQFLCRVNEVYPKPEISFNINNQPQLEQVKHNEHIVLKNDFYVVKTSATLDFMVVHNNHKNNFACVVTPGVPSSPPIIKTVTIRVKGIYLIDNSCIDNVELNVGDKDVEVACRFYAYPEPNVHWTVASFEDVHETNEEKVEDKENVEETSEVKKSVKVLENNEEGQHSYSIQVV
jgi:hypothetical protein